MPQINVDENLAVSNVLIAAVVNQQIEIRGVQLIAATGPVTITLEDEDGTNLIGPMTITNTDGGGFVFPPVSRDAPPYQTVAAGKGLNLLLSAGIQVGGALQYEVV